MITIEKYLGINVLRDDLLIGGTKSILMPSLITGSEEFVYASPVYGAFQIALSAYCQSINKKATIFCAKRKIKHENTLKCIDYGANIIEIPVGYLSVIEKHAKDYALLNNAKKLVFGAKTETSKNLIADRVLKVINFLGKEPDEIWCAIGSGTLAESILIGTKKALVCGVQVGADYQNNDKRLNKFVYHKSFEKSSNFEAGFQSTKNYDLKAFEYCVKYKKSNNVLFWNVF